MIGILLVTHEDFGEAMKKSAELIVGVTEDVKSLGLNRGDDIVEFSDRLKAKVQEMACEDGVLILTDLFGASPYNASAMISRDKNLKYRCISGLNMPMLLEAITGRYNSNIEDLVKKCMEFGKDNIRELFTEMNKDKGE